MTTLKSYLSLDSRMVNRQPLYLTNKIFIFMSELCNRLKLEVTAMRSIVLAQYTELPYSFPVESKVKGKCIRADVTSVNEVVTETTNEAIVDINGQRLTMDPR